MAKKSGPVDPLKAKEAQRKKIAIALAAVLVIVLVIQVPKLMKQLGGSSSHPPAASTVASPAPVTSATPATPATSATPGAAAGSGSGAAGPVTKEPTAAVGRLASFGSFVGKDPFASQAPSTKGATATTTRKSGTTSTPPTPPTPPSVNVNPTSAVIAVNGVQEQIDVGADFPSSEPFFHLVSLTAHTAKISIAGGSLASGDATLTLNESKPVTLMNTTDGRRYKIELFPQGTTIATVPATTTAAPPTTSTPGSIIGGTTTAGTTVGN